MYTLQEITQKFPEQLKTIGKHLDAANSFHPSDVTMMPGPYVAHDFGLKRAEALGIRESLKAMPLSYIIKEYLISGLAGASNLIPDKIYDEMLTAGSMQDIGPLVAPIVSCPGSALDVDIETDGSFAAHYKGGGGETGAETIATSQITITPKLFDVAPAITLEMIEDSQFDLMAMHLRRAAEVMGEFSTQQILARLITGNHGDGTQNTWTTVTANTTALEDLAQGWAENYGDKHPSDVVILGPEPLTDILSDVTVSIYASQWHERAATVGPLEWGTFMGMNVVCIPMNETYAGDGALYLGSKWHSFVLRKEHAMKIVRKRWLRIDNYSDPIRDLVGAKISARQEAACIYNDASCEITEL
jgi:hypothetical protein